MTQQRPALPAQLLWAVFLFFQLMIAGLMIVLWTSAVPNGTFQDALRVDLTQLNNPVVAVLLVVAAGNIGLGFFLPRLMSGKAANAGRPIAFSQFVIRLVFFEACSLFGIVILVMSGQLSLALMCVAVTMAAMLVSRPTE